MAFRPHGVILRWHVNIGWEKWGISQRQFLFEIGSPELSGHCVIFSICLDVVVEIKDLCVPRRRNVVHRY